MSKQLEHFTVAIESIMDAADSILSSEDLAEFHIRVINTLVPRNWSLEDIRKDSRS